MEAEQVTLDDFIVEENAKLVKVGSERSEQSFGLGCTLGILPVVGMIIILAILGVLNLISGFFALIMGALALVGIASLVASYAKKRSIEDTYKYNVKLEIERYLHDYSLDRQEFDTRAYQILPPDAPLQAYITPPPEAPLPAEGETSQEESR